jgi:hypothetical protein
MLWEESFLLFCSFKIVELQAESGIPKEINDEFHSHLPLLTGIIGSF